MVVDTRTVVSQATIIHKYKIKCHMTEIKKDKSCYC